MGQACIGVSLLDYFDWVTKECSWMHRHALIALLSDKRSGFQRYPTILAFQQHV